MSKRIISFILVLIMAVSTLPVYTYAENPPVPPVPKLEFCSDTIVSVAIIGEYEYRCDNGPWQTANVFFDLLPAHEYTIYQRDSKYPGYVSEGLKVTTDKSQNETVPLRPVLESVTDTTVTLKYVEGYEYQILEGAWQDSNVFTSLKPGRTYAFYQRIKGSDTMYPGDLSDKLKVTTLKKNLINYKNGDIISLGSYPSSLVTDTDLENKLNDVSASWTSYDYYIDGKTSDFMKYKDIEYRGQKYRGVKFSSYRPYYCTLSSSVANSYQDNNGYRPDTVY